MDPIATHAARALEQHPHPALRLGELRTLVVEQIRGALDAAHLRSVLERHPSIFRILDPWKGPWRETGPKAESFSLDPWVLLATDPAGDGAPSPSEIRMRESVRWLGRSVDRRSSATICRWNAIALSERETRSALQRAA